MTSRQDVPYGASPDITITISSGTQRTIFSVTMTWEMVARMKNSKDEQIENLAMGVADEVRSWIIAMVNEARVKPDMFGG